jgi:hypothetical protein
MCVFSIFNWFQKYRSIWFNLNSKIKDEKSIQYLWKVFIVSFRGLYDFIKYYKFWSLNFFSQSFINNFICFRLCDVEYYFSREQ